LTLKYDLLTLKMTSLSVENVTVELAVLKTPNTDLKVIYVALQEVTIAKELTKWGDLTLKYDTFDLEDDLKCT